MLKRFSAIFFAFIVFAFALFYSGCKKEDFSGKDLYEVKAEYLDNGLIAVDLTVFYYQRYANQSEALFFVYPKINHRSVTNFDLISVKLSEKAADFFIEENILHVKTDNRKLYEINIKYILKYDMTAFSGDCLYLGDFLLLAVPFDGQFLTLSDTNYGKPFISESFDVNCQIILPSKYYLSGGGFVGSCDLPNEKTLYNIRGDDMKSFSLIFFSDYSVDIKKWGNRSVIYCFYDQINSRKRLDFIVKCLNFFESLISPYPFDAFTVLEGFSFNEANQCLLVTKSHGDSEFYFNLAYMIAAEWVRYISGADMFRDYYMAEGLCYYLSACFFAHYNYGIDVQKLYESAAKRLDSYLLKGGKILKYDDYPTLCGFKNEEDYFVLGTVKPYLDLCLYEEANGMSTTIENIAALLKSADKFGIKPSHKSAKLLFGL